MMDDLIRRQDAIDAVGEIHPLDYNAQAIKAKIEKLPSAQPEQKRGEWIDDGLDAIGVMGIEYRWQKCSNCGNIISKAPIQRFPNFCSECGADMRKEEGGLGTQ